MTVEKTVLGNGVTILSENVPYLRSATVGVWISGGSRDESPPENGIAHFIEHPSDTIQSGAKRASMIDVLWIFLNKTPQDRDSLCASLCRSSVVTLRPEGRPSE